MAVQCSFLEISLKPQSSRCGHFNAFHSECSFLLLTLSYHFGDALSALLAKPHLRQVWSWRVHLTFLLYSEITLSSPFLWQVHVHRDLYIWITSENHCKRFLHRWLYVFTGPMELVRFQCHHDGVSSLLTFWVFWVCSCVWGRVLLDVCMTVFVSESLWTQWYGELMGTCRDLCLWFLLVRTFCFSGSNSNSVFMWRRWAESLQLGGKVGSNFLWMLPHILFPLRTLTMICTPITSGLLWRLRIF